MTTLASLFSKVKTGFQKLAAGKLLTKALNISSNMNGNTYFPTPTPDMPTIDAAIAAYQSAVVAAENRDKAAVQVKKQTRISLIVLLNQLATYINFTANGDIVMLGTTGYDLYKNAEPVVVEKPTLSSLTAGPNPSQLTTKAKGGKGARSMMHQYTTNAIMPENGWTSITTTSKTYTFSGLTKGQEYWVRVAAVGSNGQVVYSDPLSRIVQ